MGIFASTPVEPTTIELTEMFAAVQLQSFCMTPEDS